MAATSTLGDEVTIDVDARTVTLPQRLPELPPIMRMQHHRAVQDFARELGIHGTRWDPETEARVEVPMRIVDLVQGYPTILLPAYAYYRLGMLLGKRTPSVREFLADWQVVETAPEPPDPTTAPPSGS